MVAIDWLIKWEDGIKFFVKIIDLKLAYNELNALHILKNEAYIPKLYKVLIEGDRCSLYFRFIEGKHLFEFNTDLRHVYAKQAFLHYKNMYEKYQLIHDDLHDANIMIDSAGNVYILDYETSVINDNYNLFKHTSAILHERFCFRNCTCYD